MPFPIENKLNSSLGRNNANNILLSEQPTTDQIEHRLHLQNRSLAKKNSFLMTKISDLETKISELIQQNLELRAINAKSEDQKRRWLEEKLGVIENGICQRFEEMFQMFSTIRTNEHLAPPSITLSNNMNSLLPGSSSDKTVSFEDPKSPLKASSRKERRRRSSRRQSIYIASPPSPQLDLKINSGSEPQDTNDDSELEDLANRTIEKELDQPKINPDDQIFPNPIMEFLIPEENLEEKESEDDLISHATSLSPIKFASPIPNTASNFTVFSDSQNEIAEDLSRTKSMEEKIKKLAEDSVQSLRNESYGGIQKEIEDYESYDTVSNDDKLDSSKIKHANSKNNKVDLSKDEQMPESITTEILSSRNRRTRGKQVNYAEPSLRKKMRRQSEKLTDAVIEKEILDRIKQEVEDRLPLKLKEPDSRKSRQTIANIPQNDSFVDKSTDLGVESDSTIKQLEMEDEFIQASRDSPISQHKRHLPLTEKDDRNITKRRKPLGKLNENKLQTRNNKAKTKQNIDSKSEELAAFDLVEECAVGIPKTYKNNPDIKAKKTGSRRHSMLL